RRRRQGHRLHGARRDGRPRQRTDPRPGGGSGPSRRHGRDPARAGEGGRAPPLPAGPPRAARGRVVRRALLSVYDKTGLVDFARGLVDLGFELVSSGKTASALAEAGGPVTTVEDVTGAPEMLDGRGKTLHPRIPGGLLADLGKGSHRAPPQAQGITPHQRRVRTPDPFLERPDIETIDIGGPAMVRAAAKNHAWVGVVTGPDQYDGVLEELRARDGVLSDATRRRLALEAFAHTAAYDAAIVRWLQHGEKLPRHLVLALERTPDELRYGENPHQQAARYRRAGTTSWWDAVQQPSGLALSYLNYYDTQPPRPPAHPLGPPHRPRRAVRVPHPRARHPLRSCRRHRRRHRVPAGARVRRAVRVRGDRRPEPAGRRRHRRAHGRRPAGRRDRRARLRARHARRA